MAQDCGACDISVLQELYTRAVVGAGDGRSLQHIPVQNNLLALPLVAKALPGMSFQCDGEGTGALWTG